MANTIQSMRIGPYRRVGPDLHTEWGTYASPYIVGAQPPTRPHWAPLQLRGSRGFKQQPRYIGPLGAEPEKKEPVVPPHQKEPFLGLGIFGAMLGAGLLYVLLK
jgi:hypothetical protein